MGIEILDTGKVALLTIKPAHNMFILGELPEAPGVLVSSHKAKYSSVKPAEYIVWDFR